MIRYYFKIYTSKEINNLLELATDESTSYEIIEHDYLESDELTQLNINSNIKYESFIFNGETYSLSTNGLYPTGVLKYQNNLNKALNSYIINLRIKKLNKI